MTSSSTKKSSNSKTQSIRINTFDPNRSNDQQQYHYYDTNNRLYNCDKRNEQMMINYKNCSLETNGRMIYYDRATWRMYERIINYRYCYESHQKQQQQQEDNHVDDVNIVNDDDQKQDEDVVMQQQQPNLISMMNQNEQHEIINSSLNNVILSSSFTTTNMNHHVSKKKKYNSNYIDLSPSSKPMTTSSNASDSSSSCTKGFTMMPKQPQVPGCRSTECSMTSSLQCYNDSNNDLMNDHHYESSDHHDVFELEL